MGMTRQTWEKKVAPGEAVTVVDLLKLAREKKTKTSISRYSSFLSFMVRKGEATKAREPGIKLVHYKKAGGQKQAIRKDSGVQEFNLLQLGQGVMAVIDDLKKQIRALREELTDANVGVKDLIAQNIELKKLYEKSQQRILELNTGKGRTFNLSQLQEVRNNLPEGKHA